MRKRIPCLLIALMAILLMGCGYSEEEKQQHEEYKEQGRENALEYVKEKYGFDAKVNSVSNCFDYGTGPIPRFNPDATGYVIAYLSDGNDIFQVFITGEHEDTEGYDNYQEKQITKDFTDLFQKNTGLSPIKLALDYGKYCHYDGGTDRMHLPVNLINEYYDGNNLLDIIGTNQNSACSCLVAGEDLSALDPDSLHTEYGLSRFILVNYRPDDNNAITVPEELSFSTDEYAYDDFGITADSFLVSSEGASFYREFTLHELNEFMIVTYDGAPVTLEKATIDDDSAFKGHGYYENYKRITDAYTIKTDADAVLVFPNKDKLTEPVDEKELSLGIQSVSSKTGDKSYSKQSFGRIWLNRSKDLKFAVFAEWKD